MLTYREVASKWGVSPKTVSKWIAEGRLRAVKLGYRTRRIAISEAERFERERMGVVR